MGLGIRQMQFIYLSPHLDDAIFSCGGIIWEQVNQGDQVEVWTIFSGDPPTEELTPFAERLHARWGEFQNPYKVRRDEDQKACAFLGVPYRHLGYQDCIYRRNPETGKPLINSEMDLFPPGPLHEKSLISELHQKLTRMVDKNCIVCGPIGVGGHTDHRFVRAGMMDLPNKIKYYPDFPYTSTAENSFENLIPEDAKPIKTMLSEQGLRAWQQAMVFYRSQISSFWKSTGEMEEAVREFADSPRGCVLWE
jgi:LmbE family N-acetylglucosaminyl deacetylase